MIHKYYTNGVTFTTLCFYRGNKNSQYKVFLFLGTIVYKTLFVLYMLFYLCLDPFSPIKTGLSLKNGPIRLTLEPSIS